MDYLISLDIEFPVEALPTSTGNLSPITFSLTEKSTALKLNIIYLFKSTLLFNFAFYSLIGDIRFCQATPCLNQYWHMSFFYFVNCMALAYGPFFIAYKYSGLTEYCSIWKCVHAALIYFLTQLVKMLILATFFPASESEGFDPLPELMKSSADILDIVGLHIVIMNQMVGKGEVRFISAGFGWAFAHSAASRFLSFWVGARATAFHWKYIQMALDSNIEFAFYLAVSSLVWLVARKDLSHRLKRLVVSLLAFYIFHAFIFDAAFFYLRIQQWNLLMLKAVSAAVLTGLSFMIYSQLGVVH